MEDRDFPPMTSDQKFLAIFVVPLIATLTIMLIIYSFVPGPQTGTVSSVHGSPSKQY